MEHAQTEYTLAYGLIFGFLLLGMLVVCIPRPRKVKYLDPIAAEKERKQLQKEKTLAKKKKKSAKKMRKKAKAKAKAQK